MTEKQLEMARKEYQAGQADFERGEYRLSVKHLETAVNLADRSSRLGGEILLWLVTAYEAMGERDQAIALCKQLQKHPSYSVRNQATRLVYILEAPKLNMRPEWLVEIPDMTNLDNQVKSIGLIEQPKTAKSAPPKRSVIEEPVDLSKINNKENYFMWVVLMGLILLITIYAIK